MHLGGFLQAHQIVRVQVLEDPSEESIFEIDYGKRQFRPDARPLEVGDRILVSVSRVPGHLPQAYFMVLRPATITLTRSTPPGDGLGQAFGKSS